VGTTKILRLDGSQRETRNVEKPEGILDNDPDKKL